MSSDQAVEQEIQAKGLTAPRVTQAGIEAKIKAEYYFTGAQAVGPGYPPAHPALANLTFCILVLANDYTVVGKSACASPENYDRQLGQKIARNDAVRQVWALEGYVLRESLYERDARAGQVNIAADAAGRTGAPA